MAKLFLQQPEGDQLLTELDSSQTYVLGRNDDCSICIPDESVSGHHARLSPSEEGWVLEDLGSSNGTIVGGQTLAQPVLLTNGSQVILGPQITLLFVDEAPAEAAAEETAAAEPATEPEAAPAAEPREEAPKRSLKFQ